MSHPIAAISFRPPSLDCACGHALAADTAEELEAAYQAHRKAVGAIREATMGAREKYHIRADHQRVPWDGLFDYVYIVNDWLFDR